MRAAEILVNFLLAEATNAFAVVWGPKLPQQGFYATGKDDKQVMLSIKRKIGALGAVSRLDKDLLASWLLRGYAWLVRNERGQIIFYGQKPVQLSPELIHVFGLRPTTQVFMVEKPITGGLTASRKHGADFGVS